MFVCYFKLYLKRGLLNKSCFSIISKSNGRGVEQLGSSSGS